MEVFSDCTYICYLLSQTVALGYKSGRHINPGPFGGSVSDVSPPFGSHANRLACPLLEKNNNNEKSILLQVYDQQIEGEMIKVNTNRFTN